MRKPTRPVALPLALLLGVGCASAPAGAPPLRLVADGGRPTHLSLLPASGIRINARLAPALELEAGGVLRFDGPRTADSAYYAAPPTAELPPGAPARGRLRASICREDQAVCRSVTLEL